MKYPRTYHLKFSPEIHSDDKTHQENEIFVSKRVIITEKMDGGNTCLHNGQTFARSINQQTNCPSFAYIKNKHAYKTYNQPEQFYGENIYAIHSIEYDKLPDFFMLFAVKNDDVWKSWDSVIEYANKLDLLTVPVLFDGIFKSTDEIKEWMDNRIKKPSTFGGKIEGFVIRLADEFNDSEFSLNVAKYVRKGHVQTDKHWSVNWEPQKGA